MEVYNKVSLIPLSAAELQFVDGGGVIGDALLLTAGSVFIAAGFLTTLAGCATGVFPAAGTGLGAVGAGITIFSNVLGNY